MRPSPAPPPAVDRFEQIRVGGSDLLRIHLSRSIDASDALLVIDRGPDFVLLRALPGRDHCLAFACSSELVDGEPDFYLQVEGSTLVLDQPIERARA